MKRSINIMAIAVAVLLGLASCSHEEPASLNRNEKTLEAIYESLDRLPRQSIYDQGGITRTGLTLPVITEADLAALASLSMEELQARRQSRLEAMGAEKIAQIEERKAENIAKMYDLMGGHEGLDRLKAFMTEYLKGAKGWARISELLPQGLTDRQAKGYLAMAVYVDNIARPIYSYLTIINPAPKDNITTTRQSLSVNSHGYCKTQLANALLELGLEINVDDFIAAMDDTGEEAGPPINETWEDFDPDTLWEDYLNCRRIFGE